MCGGPKHLQALIVKAEKCSKHQKIDDRTLQQQTTWESLCWYQRMGCFGWFKRSDDSASPNALYRVQACSARLHLPLTVGIVCLQLQPSICMEWQRPLVHKEQQVQNEEGDEKAKFIPICVNWPASFQAHTCICFMPENQVFNRYQGIVCLISTNRKIAWTVAYQAPRYYHRPQIRTQQKYQWNWAKMSYTTQTDRKWWWKHIQTRLLQSIGTTRYLAVFHHNHYKWTF